MKTLHIAEDIMSVSELEARASEIVAGACGSPMVMTPRGKVAAVLIVAGDYDRLSDESLVVAAIEQGLADAEAGRVVDDDDLDGALAARIGNLAG